MTTLGQLQPEVIKPVGTVPEAHWSQAVRHTLKRMFDIAAAALGLLLVLPLMLLVATVIVVDSPGPVFFVQKRVGVRGKSFRMFKFRSMITDAEHLRDSLKPEHEGPLFKMRHDPRVTRVGAFIRRYSLDELPQLFNVLRGDMSLVGPRPPLPSEVAVYDQRAHRRLLVRPGLTGLWQVSGRSDLSWEDGLRLDLHYVDNWSLTGDAVLVLRTFGAVLACRGAY